MNKNVLVIENNRWELMLDETLIDYRDHLDFVMQPPKRGEIVLKIDKAWENQYMLGLSVIQVDNEVRLYYRGGQNANACIAISNDSVNFEKPNLGLIKWDDGSKNNNIITNGNYNIVPFKDDNPDNQGSRFKGVNTSQCDEMLIDDEGLAQTDFIMGCAPKPAYSEDGFVWNFPEKLISNQFIGMAGFDSVNQAFYDVVNKCYRMYARYWTNKSMFSKQCYEKFPISDTFDADEKHSLPYSYTRQIMGYTSADYENWSKPVANQYAPWLPVEQLYTNTVRPIPGAEHILLSLPNRYHPSRMKNPAHPYPGTNDTMLMSSRDGVYWHRTFQQPWISGDLDLANWSERNHYVTVGMTMIDEQHVFYMNEHYRSDSACMRRLTLPRHRFASLHAGGTMGEFMTRPVIFDEGVMHLNYATSAVGKIQISVVDINGYPIQGFTFEEGEEKFGNALEETYAWKHRKLSELSGKPVRFLFRLAEADLFAFCIK